MRTQGVLANYKTDGRWLSATRSSFRNREQRGLGLIRVLLFLVLVSVFSNGQATATQSETKAAAKHESKISQRQANELFRSLDSILKFASDDTRLPIRHPVKRALASRDEVERNLNERLKNDEDAQRLQRSEIVLKKFGLIPRDFDLRSYLVSLLREQVAGFYNAKDKTIYMMDWIPEQQQLPVMAHELTHALQDQSVDLEEWLKGDKEGEKSSGNKPDKDYEEIEADEEQSARQALVEGQGMAVLVDYLLRDSGQNVLTAPFFVEGLKQGMAQSQDSPVFSRGPLYLRESLSFPYRYGLGFVQQLLLKGGKDVAYAGALRNPPRTTRQIMTPKAYIDGEPIVPLSMPDVSILVSKKYETYDAGSVGQFDVNVLLKQFAGEKVAEKLSPEWRAGGYYAAVRHETQRDAKESLPRARNDNGKTTPPRDADPIALLYLSRWSSPEAAKGFAAAYADTLLKRYKFAQGEEPSVHPENAPAPTITRWTTDEGPVLIETEDKTVLVLESFDSETMTRIHDAVFPPNASKSAMATPSAK